jgi:hypothetical protein
MSRLRSRLGPAVAVRPWTAVLLLLLVATSCGDAPGPGVASAGADSTDPVGAGSAAGAGGAAGPAEAGSASGPGGGSGELVAHATVLEAPGTGPELCLGGVAASLPPQCSGPTVIGWDWAAVDAETAAGTTWGNYVVVGTYDGSAFTLTRPAVAVEEYDGPALAGPEEDPLTSPCPPPDGGWRVLDADTTTQESLDRTVRRAQRLPGYAEVWLDQSINHADPNRDPEAMNDPTKLVLNVRVTEDLAGAERRLRETWGGALCVSKARRTATELRAIQQELNGREGMLFSFTGHDVVELGVVHDDGSLQRELDERYGAGVVRVQSALRPYRD